MLNETETVPSVSALPQSSTTFTAIGDGKPPVTLDPPTCVNSGSNVVGAQLLLVNRSPSSKPVIEGVETELPAGATTAKIRIA